MLSGTMFEAKKALIVVYKDELLVNQLKKMVETCDDNEQGIVGTRDGSIDIISWTEKVWMGNKQAGNIQGKILFLDDIKGTDKLIPVIDIQFDDCGVKFGWAGNQAILFAEPKILAERKDYDAFLKKLSELSVPAFLKTTNEDITASDLSQKPKNFVKDSAEQVAAELSEEVSGIAEEIPVEHKKFDVILAARKAFSSGADAIGKVGSQVASKSEEFFRDKALMKRQMLFYGIINLYNNGLEKFMNL